MPLRIGGVPAPSVPVSVPLNVGTDVQFHRGLERTLSSVQWQTGSFCGQP